MKTVVVALLPFGACYAPAPAAETPRTIVHATMIADTDDGWYGWYVENVALPKTTVTIKKWPLFGTATFARSAPLTVTFPKGVLVHHAWVTQARAGAETTIGWNALGDFACEVPDFPDGGPGFTPVVRRQAATTPATAPAAGGPPGAAVVVSQPFPIGAWTCGSAGNFAFDLAAMRTARASQYSSAISYCQPVRGYYIFRADFMPD